MPLQTVNGRPVVAIGSECRLANRENRRAGGFARFRLVRSLHSEPQHVPCIGPNVWTDLGQAILGPFQLARDRLRYRNVRAYEFAASESVVLQIIVCVISHGTE